MLNTTDKIIKHKTGLLNLAEELGNVSKACQVMGMSRDTFAHVVCTNGRPQKFLGIDPNSAVVFGEE